MRAFRCALGQGPLILLLWQGAASAPKLNDQQPFLTDGRADGTAEAVLSKADMIDPGAPAPLIQTCPRQNLKAHHTTASLR